VANAAASIAIGIAVFAIAASMAAVQRGWGETPSSTECHTRAIPQRWGVNILTTKRRLDHPYSSAGKMAKWGGVGLLCDELYFVPTFGNRQRPNHLV
jgi:hypothetical protein